MSVTRERIAGAVNTLQLAAGILGQVDLAEVLRHMRAASVAADYFDPALAGRGTTSLFDLIRLAEAAQPLHAEFHRQREAIARARSIA